MVLTANTEEHQPNLELEPKLIRITNHGKIQTWVTFALEFLKENGSKPLVLHTLPASKPTTEEPLAEPIAPSMEPTPHIITGKCNSTSTIPRLITVAEIIKREYLKTLKPSSSTISGLHQYNEIRYLEAVDDMVDSERGATALALALGGKNHLIQKHSPFMRITLCKTTMPLLIEQGATYQQPAVRKISKSAHRRMKKRITAKGAGSEPN